VGTGDLKHFKAGTNVNVLLSKKLRRNIFWTNYFAVRKVTIVKRDGRQNMASMRPLNKRNIKIAVVIIAVYLGSYVILSLCGGYVLTQSGLLRYGFGLSVSDIQQWQPRFAFCQRFRQVDEHWTLRANFLGYVFAPLILCDQAFVHKTVHLFDTKTGEPIAK
jgi:hypothetical protein